MKVDHQFRVFDLRVQRAARHHVEGELETGERDHRLQKLAYPRSVFFDCVFPRAAHAVCGESYFTFFFRAGTFTLGVGIILLKNNCWAMPTKFPVSQYNTRPLDAL